MTTAIVRLGNLERALQTLATEIRNRYRGDLRELRLETILDEVFIRGVATSYYGKSLALSEVRRRCGLRVVANQMQVVDAASNTVTGTNHVRG